MTDATSKLHLDQLPARGNADPKRWGVILAGGDGSRLRPVTRLISGDDRPKQFCPLLDGQTLVDRTRQRALRLIRGEQLLFPVTRSHQAFYLEEPGIRPSQRIVQPSNKGTLPPILFSLLSIERKDPGALVAVLPSDHHYSDEDGLHTDLHSAFTRAGERPDSVILMGAVPQSAETEYGWIERGEAAGNGGGNLFRVRGFCEKPTQQVAHAQFNQGSLWNTFVMVGHVGAFLGMLRAAVPELVATFRRHPGWAGAEAHIPDSLYAPLTGSDFSRNVLAKQPQRLLTMPLTGTNWSDLGDPGRLISILQEEGHNPRWMREWISGAWHSSIAATAREAA